MTNEQIIFNARCELMENGVIGTTGRTLQFKEKIKARCQVILPRPGSVTCRLRQS